MNVLTFSVWYSEETSLPVLLITHTLWTCSYYDKYMLTRTEPVVLRP